jgi:ribosome-binding protein aMBF1 (putative translation factor)
MIRDDSASRPRRFFVYSPWKSLHYLIDAAERIDEGLPVPVKAAREARGWTQDQLTQALGAVSD